MHIIITKLSNPTTGAETGSILTAGVGQATTLQQKIACEKVLSDYAFTVLYPGQGLNIYSNEYTDTPSIVAIRDINGLPQEMITYPAQ